MSIINTIAASEIKRRGVAAIDENIKKGAPIHIIKNNKPTYVVLSEEDYLALTKQAQPIGSVNLWELLDNRPWKPTRDKKSIQSQIKKEREDWDKK